jgi:hypothetical protein
VPLEKVRGEAMLNRREIPAERTTLTSGRPFMHRHRKESARAEDPAYFGQAPLEGSPELDIVRGTDSIECVVRPRDVIGHSIAED